MLTDRQRQQTAARQQRFRQRQRQARQQEQAAKGLPPLPAIPTMPGYARWRAALQAAQALLEQVSQEMEDYYTERSEEWQEGYAGTGFAEQQEALARVLSQLEDVAL